MSIPEDHKELLARKDYALKCSRKIFTDDEYKILQKYGYWLEGLASGAIQPFTIEQGRFVIVAQGETEPVGPFEKLWVKYQKRQKWERESQNVPHYEIAPNTSPEQSTHFASPFRLVSVSSRVGCCSSPAFGFVFQRNGWHHDHVY